MLHKRLREEAPASLHAKPADHAYDDHTGAMTANCRKSVQTRRVTRREKCRAWSKGPARESAAIQPSMSARFASRRRTCAGRRRARQSPNDKPQGGHPAGQVVEATAKQLVDRLIAALAIVGRDPAGQGHRHKSAAGNKGPRSRADGISFARNVSEVDGGDERGPKGEPHLPMT